MKLEKAGALALVGGTVAYIGLMAAHPLSPEGGHLFGPIALNGLVHGVAIVAAPVLLFGALALTRFLGAERALPLLGLCFYAIGTVAVMGAASMSGLVMSQLVEAAHTPGAGASGVPFQGLANLTHWINQAFAQVYVAMLSIALLLWSVSWPGKAWIVRGLGVVIALGTLVWQLSGTLVLNIHGMGAVVLLQALWTFAAAGALWRGREDRT
ncbi:hypothetical protein [Terricaulis sp.]|uniref:hypothetical protein n=1 Tax=Terricaulis sp. TaxID=2768686 RepID=UPI0037834B67